MKSKDYNKREYETGRLTWDHITKLVESYQRSHNLVIDGKAGPKTRASLDPVRRLGPMSVDDQGWLSGTGVTIARADDSWSYSRLRTPTGKPTTIVAHYTATNHGSGMNMAKRRMRPYRQGIDRPASWHVTVEGDGEVIQMISMLRGAWHAGGGQPLDGVSPNRISVGIELVGHGDHFPEAQVEAACRVWKAIVDWAGIFRDRAMVEHSALDPRRRSDPGRVWMGQHAERVLDYAYT